MSLRFQPFGRADGSLPQALEAADRPVGKHAGLVGGSVGGVAVDGLVDDAITVWTDALREPPVRTLRAAGNSPALDHKSAVVDPAHRSFGAGGKQKHCKRCERTHFRLTKK